MTTKITEDDVVFIVEDDKIQNYNYENIFQSRKIKFTIFEDAEQMLKALGEKNIPNLIIIDYSLPGMSGHDLISELRLRGIKSGIVVVTVSMEIEDKNKCISAGADSFLSKPVEQKELMEELALAKENWEARIYLSGLEFSEYQIDFIKEISTIGLGLGSSKFSELIQAKINLGIDKVNFNKTSNLISFFERENSSHIFELQYEGEFCGSVLFALDLYNFQNFMSEVEHFNDVEDLIDLHSEFSNIILRSFVGTFSNILKLNFSFKPIEVFEGMERLRNEMIRLLGSSESLLIKAQMKAESSEVGGNLILLFDKGSLQKFRLKN